MSDKSGDTWKTIAEAEAMLGVSKRTIQRRIKLGEIKSKLDDGIRYVKLDITSDKYSDTTSDISPQLVKSLERENQELRQQIDFFREQTTKLQEDLRQERVTADQAKERSDTIALQLTRQLEQSQRLLEYHGEP